MHGHLRSLRSRVLLAAVTALGLALLVSAGSASAARAPVNTRAAMRTALAHLPAGWHPANHALGRHTSLGTGLMQLTSTNWSGYADDNSKGNTYKSVTGHWTEPKITGCNANVLSAVIFFVGLDGLTSSTVEQAGSLALCPGGGSTVPVYATWWEMFPTNDVQFIGTTVKPGDNISASVVRAGTKYTLKVTDSTTAGNNFSTTQTCSATTCLKTSAEWIAEAPTNNGAQVPLAKFGAWTVKNATVKAGLKSGTIKTFPHDKIIMEDASSIVLAQPGALNTTGNQFKDTWKAST